MNKMQPCHMGLPQIYFNIMTLSALQGQNLMTNMSFLLVKCLRQLFPYEVNAVQLLKGREIYYYYYYCYCWLVSELGCRSDWTASTGREEVDRLSDWRQAGFRARILLPGSGIVPHVYSSPPRSQPRGHCTADIPGPPPQASSSSFFLYGLEINKRGGQKRKTQRQFVNVS